MKLALTFAAVAVVAAGCATTHQPTGPDAGAATAGQLPTGVSSWPMPARGTCHMRTEGGQPLPDPTCTPGATNPQVTQENLKETACKSGWTATIRPPASYTDRLKRQQIAAYGYTDTRMGDYEEDHFIPLSLGGNSTSPLNLWPEPGDSPNQKDKVEWAAQRAVCSGRINLTDAQREMAEDWVKFGVSLGVM